MAENLRLPSLNALRTFNSVARHKSFRQAAKELSVSPQAVGQQIKILEDMLQVTLFDRRGRTIELTDPAILLFHYVQAGFEEFAEGVRRISNAALANRVKLNVSPFFATYYLLPRLSSLKASATEVELNLTTKVEMPDFAREEIDMTVHWGYGNWPEYNVTFLVSDPKIICCVPSIAEQIRSPADLVRFTLLDTVMSDHLWSDILRHLSVEPSKADRRIALEDAAMMRNATRQGIGIGLLSGIVAEADLKSGTLVAPLGPDVMTGMETQNIPAFYLVAPRAHLRMKGISVVHRWLSQQDWSGPPPIV